MECAKRAVVWRRRLGAGGNGMGQDIAFGVGINDALLKFKKRELQAEAAAATTAADTAPVQQRRRLSQSATGESPPTIPSSAGSPMVPPTPSPRSVWVAAAEAAELAESERVQATTALENLALTRKRLRGYAPEVKDFVSRAQLKLQSSEDSVVSVARNSVNWAAAQAKFVDGPNDKDGIADVLNALKQCLTP